MEPLLNVLANVSIRGPIHDFLNSLQVFSILESHCDEAYKLLKVVVTNELKKFYTEHEAQDYHLDIYLVMIVNL